MDPADGLELARRASAAVAARLAGLPPDERPPDAAALRAPGACFVTLERDGQLRGCIGTLEAVRPLYLDAQRNAERAMRDPRLPPVTEADWPLLDVKVAVLTAPEPLPVADRAALVAAVRPGVDGLLLVDRVRRATFLPSVWAKLPDPEDFVAALLRKGGWRSWPDELEVRRYTTAEFRDAAPRGPLPAGAEGAGDGPAEGAAGGPGSAAAAGG
jgi:AmmeMemoRadiSam system protein A